MAAKNPLLRDPEIVRRFQALPDDSREALKEFLSWLYGHSRREAERCWRTSKAPMAVYWKAVSAWSFHIMRIL